MVLESGAVGPESVSLGREIVSLVLEKAPLFLAAAASCVLTFLAQRRAGVVASIDLLPLGSRLANAVVSYADYLGMMIWPRGLAVIYPHPGMPPAWKVVLSAVILAGVSALALAFARKAPYLLVGWLWYLGTLVPVIGIVQVGAQALADRYTYLPLIGVFVMIAWGLADLTRARQGELVHLAASLPEPGSPTLRSRSVAALALLALAACAALTWAQAATWKNNFTLYRHAIDVTRNNVVALNNLGITLDRQGRREEAIGYFHEALRFKADHADVLSNLGVALAGSGKIDEAIGRYTEAIRVNPRLARTRFNLANALLQQGRTEEAIGQLSEAVAIDPGLVEARFNLAGALLEARRIEEALALLARLARERPDDAAVHRGLGIALARAGRFDEAIVELSDAVRLQPGDPVSRYDLGLALLRWGRGREAADSLAAAIRLAPEHREALVTLARIRAAHPDLLLRDGTEAERLARKASDLALGRDPEALRALAMARAEMGSYEEAAVSARRAEELAMAAGLLSLVQELRAEQASYEAHRPWRLAAEP